MGIVKPSFEFIRELNINIFFQDAKKRWQIRMPSFYSNHEKSSDYQHYHIGKTDWIVFSFYM